MKSKWMSAAAISMTSIVVGGTAVAQEKDQVNNPNEDRSRDLTPATRAVELTIGTGYSQGFGDVGSDVPKLTDTAQAGGAIQLGVGYRLIPQLTLGVYGTGAMFGRGDQVDSSSNVYSASAGVQADWHFLPSHHEFDPWVSLGTGWRGYWVNADQGTSSLHGLELAKLQVGVDYRISQAIAISPVVGADMSVFLTRSTPASNGYSNISNPNVNTFLFAGVIGRFDVPTGSSDSQVASR
jgi:hypothetical protein